MDEDEDTKYDYNTSTDFPLAVLYDVKIFAALSRCVFFDHMRISYTDGHKSTRNRIRSACRKTCKRMRRECGYHPALKVAAVALSEAFTSQSASAVIGEVLRDNALEKKDEIAHAGSSSLGALVDSMMDAYVEEEGVDVNNREIEAARISGKIFDIVRKAGAVFAGIASVLPQLVVAAVVASFTGGSFSLLDLASAAIKSVENTRRAYAALYKFDKSLPKGLYALDTAKDIDNTTFLTMALWSDAYFVMYLAYTVGDETFDALEKKREELNMTKKMFQRCKYVRERVKNQYNVDQYFLIPSSYATIQSGLKLGVLTIKKTKKEGKDHRLEFVDNNEDAAYGYVLAHVMQKPAKHGCRFPFVNLGAVRIVGSKNDVREITVSRGRDSEVFKYPLKKTGYTPEPGWDRLKKKGVVKLLPYHSFKVPDEDLNFLDWSNQRVLRHLGFEFAVFSKEYVSGSGELRLKKSDKYEDLKKKKKELAKDVVKTRRDVKNNRDEEDDRTNGNGKKTHE